jgi:Putative quorum-sensing-regulated virulence factor
MDDNTPMPFGKHKGTALANVPADYLLWWYQVNTDKPLIINETHTALKAYILDNIKQLTAEAALKSR